MHLNWKGTALYACAVADQLARCGANQCDAAGGTSSSDSSGSWAGRREDPPPRREIRGSPSGNASGNATDEAAAMAARHRAFCGPLRRWYAGIAAEPPDMLNSLQSALMHDAPRPQPG